MTYEIYKHSYLQLHPHSPPLPHSLSASLCLPASHLSITVLHSFLHSFSMPVCHTLPQHTCVPLTLSSTPIFLTPLITDHSTVVICCIICYNDGKEEEYSHQQRREEKEGDRFGNENEIYCAAGRPVNISETSLRGVKVRVVSKDTFRALSEVLLSFIGLPVVLSGVSV